MWLTRGPSHNRWSGEFAPSYQRPEVLICRPDAMALWTGVASLGTCSAIG